MNAGDCLKKQMRFFDFHFQHIGDGLALVLHIQGLAIKTPSFTHGARYPHVGEKIHFDEVRAVALTRLAPSALYVKAEASGFVSSDL